MNNKILIKNGRLVQPQRTPEKFQDIEFFRVLNAKIEGF